MAKKDLVGKDCIAGLNRAAKYELGHFHMYSQMANIMQQTGYFGARDYFLSDAKEEIGHYQGHVDLLNKLGVLGDMPALTPLVPNKIMTLREIIDIAYDQMVELLEFYREFYSKIEEEYPDIANHINHYLKLQDDAVGYYGDIIATMTAEKNNPNINMIIDKRLGKDA
ncbi:MAG TPA: ferritin-like domain-containing protein [Chitinophagaceae bacterium]|nr:ferritin-like domain-containing protein [Chitinophagaceae bacterium]